MSNPFDTGRRFAALDCVRALAILLVIGHHASFRFAAAAGDVVAQLVGGIGWIGVDMFFALSGYLITKILLRDGARSDIGGFFRRRFFRIVPLFAVALCTYAVASLLLGHETDNLSRLWLPALFLNGWAIPVIGVANVPFTIAWSLSVEEFAYVLLGVAALGSTRALRIMIFLFLAVALLVRFGAYLAQMRHPSELYYFVPARLDAIAYGALGALGYYDRLVRHRWSGLAFGILTGLVMIGIGLLPERSNWLVIGPGYAAFGLACALWIASLAHAPPPLEGKVSRLFASIGKLSYFIYLFHLFFLSALQKLWPGQTGPGFWVATVTATVACYLAARISWRWFEEPLIRHAHQRPMSA